MNEKPHLLVLDGLRGIAAMCVVIYHIHRSTCSHGYLAVDFFFLLSGFVIAFSYEKKLASGVMRFADFIRRRLIRLYPLVFAGMLFGTAGFMLIGIAIPSKTALTLGFAKVALKGFFLIPTTYNMRQGGVSIISANVDNLLFPVDGPLWSLFFELIVNFAYALTAKSLKLRVLLVLIALNSLIVIACVTHYQSIDYGPAPDELLAGIYRAILPFLIGVVIFRLYRDGRLPKASLSGLSFAAALLLILAWPRTVGEGSVTYDLCAELVLFPLLVALAARGVARGLVATLCRISGEISYPLYILHVPVIHIVRAAAKKVWPGHLEAWYVGNTSANLCIIIVAVAVSYACLKLYDEPVRRYLAKRLDNM